jgi:hypothetical protein
MVAAYYFSMDPMPSVGTFFLAMACVIVVTVVSFFLIPSHIPRNTAEPTVTKTGSLAS